MKKDIMVRLKATLVHLHRRIEESHKINHSRQIVFLLNSNQVTPLKKCPCNEKSKDNFSCRINETSMGLLDQCSCIPAQGVQSKTKKKKKGSSPKHLHQLWSNLCILGVHIKPFPGKFSSRSLLFNQTLNVGDKLTSNTKYGTDKSEKWRQEPRSFKYETKMKTTMRKTKIMKDITCQKNVTQRKNWGRNGEYKTWKEGRTKCKGWPKHKWLR